MKQRLIKLLAWSELEYAEFQYNSGIEYLNAYIPDDVHGIDMLLRNRIFWNWWKNHWSIRDQQFLDSDMDCMDTKKLQRIYIRYNSNLACEIYPNAHVLGSDYCRMIGKLLDAKTENL